MGCIGTLVTVPNRTAQRSFMGFISLALLASLLLTTVEGNSSSNCSVVFNGNTLNFEHCTALDSSNTYTLSWTRHPNSTPPLLTVLFQGTPEAANGWTGWGISPDGFMAGSDAVVGYGSTSGNTQSGGGGLYHMDGNTPTLLAAAQASSFMSLIPDSISVSLLNSGSLLQILANITLLSSFPSPSNVIWKSGPSADVSTGQLTKHTDLTKNRAYIDFLSDSPAPPAPADGGSPEGPMTKNQNIKIAHGWCAGIGFGVLLPLGVLVARQLRVWADPAWFYTHIALQVTGYTLGVIGWGMGIWLKGEYGDISVALPHQVSHYAVGITVFCTSTLQIITPFAKPHLGTLTRLYWNLVHWFLGYTTLILAAVNIFLGFETLDGEGVSVGPWRTVYIVYLSVWGAAFLLLEPLSWWMFFQKQRISQDQNGDMQPKSMASDIP